VTEGKPVITIRGVSSRDTTENGDPAVVVNTDGFYLNRPYAMNASLYDLERVEVLRGPQGTLNGRNSVGGAINIVTAKPTDKFEGYASVQYGNYNDLETQGAINIPLGRCRCAPPSSPPRMMDIATTALAGARTIRMTSRAGCRSPFSRPNACMA
jgi:outer membrane receptor for Fe3+-dicitrate